MRHRAQFALTLLTVLFVLACESASFSETDGGLPVPPADAGTTPPPNLELNDVSVLFPLPAAGDSIAAGLLGAASSGARGELFPRAVYASVGAISGSHYDEQSPPAPGSIGTARWEDLYVVSARVDPTICGLAPAPGSTGCGAQLRLVMQEVRDQAGSTEAFDSALHLHYEISLEDAVEFASEMALSRRGQRLGKLQVHPVMVGEGLSGPTATAVRARLLKMAGVTNLTRVTRMSARTVGFDWRFDGFDIDQPTLTTVPRAIPTLGNEVHEQRLFSGFGPLPEARFTPESNHADAFPQLADHLRAAALSPEERSRAVAGLARIDHPERHTTKTIDCASCHFTTPTDVLVARGVYGIDSSTQPDAYRADGTLVRQDDLAPTFDPDGGYNIHAFSYFGRAPGISRRTANESSAVVVYLETLK